MKKYTLYDSSNKILNTVSSNTGNLTSFTYNQNLSWIEGIYDGENYIFHGHKPTPIFKDNNPVTIVSLSCFNNMDEVYILKNIPTNTEIFVKNQFIGTASDSDNDLYLSFDTYGVYEISLINSTYNLSSQTFKLTAYEI
tara:strand:- start:984 stop:1400 length:417 start_codon:yes stop_codon:yes gene_type:complete